MNQLSTKIKQVCFVTALINMLIFSPKKIFAQTQISPKYSVDGDVNAILSKGDTLIVGGDFSHVGIFTGASAMLSLNSASPSAQFPKIMGNVYCVSTDGKGGFYICGQFRKETEDAYSSKFRIEHILADDTFESDFSVMVDAASINTILFHQGVLYIGGKAVNQIGGQKAGDLCAIDVNSKQIVKWLPSITSNYLGGVNALSISGNKLYVAGNFSAIGNTDRKSIGAVILGTGKLTDWSPELNGSCEDIQFYKNRVILGGGFGDATFNEHACALVDTVTGKSFLSYLYNRNSLYWASGVQKMAVKGDTLITFSRGTYDTRVTALDLKNGNKVIWKKYFDMTASPAGIQIAGNSVFVAGSFTKIYKTDLNNDAANLEKEVKTAVKLNLSTGDLENWYPQGNAEARCMAIDADRVFIGGAFTLLNVIERSGMFMLKTSGEQLLPLKVNIDYFSRNVTAMKLMGTTLYLGGEFSVIDGKDFVSPILAINVNTGQLSGFQSNLLGRAYSIEANDKYLFIGGDLRDPAGNSKNLFAADRVGGKLANWYPDPDKPIYANRLHYLNEKLYVGGAFNRISGEARSFMAVYNTNNLSLDNWKPSRTLTKEVTAITASSSTIWMATAANQLFGADATTGAISYAPSDSVSYYGTIHSLIVKSEHLVATGVFSVNSTGCSNALIFDIAGNKLKTHNLCPLFSAYWAGISTSVFINDDLYIGGNFTDINRSFKTPYLERYSFSPNFFDPDAVKYSFYPVQGGNGGDVSVTFRGKYMMPGATVKLSAPGLPDITVSKDDIIYTREHEMIVQFDLRLKDIGKYNVILTDAGGKEHIVEKGFEVLPFIKPFVWVQVAGADDVRTGAPSLYVIKVGNRGNCDAIGVPIYIFAPANSIVKYQNRLAHVDGSPKDTLGYALLDSLHGKPQKVKAYWLMIPRIKAGEIENIQVEVTPLESTTFTLTATINGPVFGSPMPPDQSKCLETMLQFETDIFIKLWGLTSPLGDFLECSNGLQKIFKESYRALWRNEKFYDGELVDFGSDLLGTGLSCNALVNPAGKAASLLYKAIAYGNDVYGAADAGEEIVQDCDTRMDPKGPKGSKTSRSRASRDPNEKIGIGLTGRHFISNNTPLSYGIKFENIATATADAQTVRLIDTLDKVHLDLSTFQPDFFYVGNHVANFAHDDAKWSETIDLRPGQNLLLKVTVKLDQSTGILSAEYLSIDPLTQLPTTDALLGFLPPNKKARDGEGGLYFSVNLKPGLPDNTDLANKAHIYFDNNLPITTAKWLNKLDIAAPISRVNSLPDTIDSDDATFTLKWSGSDAGVGIETYDVYYSVNNEPYQPLLLNTEKTSYKFTGVHNSTYAFYTVSRDSLRNEEYKTNPDTKTMIFIKKIHILADKLKVINPDCSSPTGSIDGLQIVNKDLTAPSYQWKNEAGTNIASTLNISEVLPGNYTLFVTSADGLFTTSYGPVIIKNGVGPQITRAPDVSDDQCGSGTGSIKGFTVANGKLPYRYEWRNSAGLKVGTTADLENLPAGMYTVTVTDAANCILTSPAFVVTASKNALVKPTVADVQVCSVGDAVLVVNNPIKSYKYKLYNSATDVVALTENATGKFKVAVNSNRSYFVSQFTNTCESEKAEVKITVGLASVKIVNLITPNNDGVNDDWKIIGIQDFPKAIVQVFDRTGAKIFQSVGYNETFKGYYNGRPLVAGTYYYIIDLNSACTRLSGSLTILR